MQCRLCELEKDLIEAHIVPRCLHAPLKNANGKPMIRLSKQPSIYPRSSHIGEYDASILCAECDGAFGEWDNYACTLLLKTIPKSAVIMLANGVRCNRVPSYDYDRFKLFLLSVIWRMSISARPAFRNVRLGPIEAQLRERLGSVLIWAIIRLLTPRIDIGQGGFDRPACC
jgi:hypothetical protein